MAGTGLLALTRQPALRRVSGPPVRHIAQTLHAQLQRAGLLLLFSTAFQPLLAICRHGTSVTPALLACQATAGCSRGRPIVPRTAVRCGPRRQIPEHDRASGDATSAYDITAAAPT